MENITEYQYAWMIYVAGAIGCCLATWLLFRRAGRAWVHFFVITVMVLLLTPYAIDVEKMIMAPAIYTLAFGYLEGGFIAVKPIAKLMLGLWASALVLSLVYQLLTRNRGQAYHEAPPSRRQDDDYHDPTDVLLAPSAHRQLTRDERIARDELLSEEPIRAIR
ncbi:hypothetical protein [Cellvibrio japonicus]|uniref:Uncharacterized protein n=1 Tax=Cellvibrio japonicus (strain Ueda107) TaxID=498211 RepID=B3PKG7_CELJU|nr:hypothetical protein [Cellvibrio japonicus]ACE84155.1 conserved hypothetical protein [Cellvibrio japonicus Ueda107]QEI12834.1 hypothetical protein FY117_11760 [Cellvibrio japonicus]QEI16408.1 hypothetical protein FY116_11765 [Cellvibrio japonicus]QEI19986.1 hypothetical protein FY115_11760 [Cellvibrio japonicus]